MGDEQYFLKVEQELKDEKIDKALWAKSSVLGSDDQDIRKQYVLLRVEALKKETRHGVISDATKSALSIGKKVLIGGIIIGSVSLAIVAYLNYMNRAIVLDGLSCWNFPENVDFESNGWLNSPYMSEDGLKEAGGRKNYYSLRGKRRLSGNEMIGSGNHYTEICPELDFLSCYGRDSNRSSEQDRIVFSREYRLPINNPSTATFTLLKYNGRGADIRMAYVNKYNNDTRISWRVNYCKILTPDELKTEMSLDASS
jgi:hypothetical protein